MKNICWNVTSENLFCPLNCWKHRSHRSTKYSINFVHCWGNYFCFVKHVFTIYSWIKFVDGKCFSINAFTMIVSSQYAHKVVLASIRRRFNVMDVVWTSKRRRAFTEFNLNSIFSIQVFQENCVTVKIGLINVTYIFCCFRWEKPLLSFLVMVLTAYISFINPG